VRFRDFRLIDSSPGPGTDVPGRVHVRVVGVSTYHAAELCLRWAVGLGRVPTGRAFPTRIARIDDDEFHARLPCLVLDEAAKLMESPSAHLRPLLLAKPCPVADALQVFQGQSTPSVFGLSNELFGNSMVSVLAKARFAPRNGFELTPDSLRAQAEPLAANCRLLETTAKIVVADATGFDIRARVALPVAVGGDVLDTQIYTKKIGCRRFRSIRQINRDEQKPFAVLATHKVSLPLGCSKALSLVASHDEQHQDATGKRQQRDPIQPLEAHQPLIVGNGRKRTEMRTLGLVVLVGFADLRNAAHGHLRRQSEALPQVSVEQLLQRNLVRCFPDKRFACQPISRRIEGAHRRFERSGLLCCRQQLGLQSKYDRYTALSLPGINAGASRARG